MNSSLIYIYIYKTKPINPNTTNNVYKPYHARRSNKLHRSLTKQKQPEKTTYTAATKSIYDKSIFFPKGSYHIF
jgi:hypothetical protein